MQDLNRRPKPLPFADGSFDAVVCSLTIDYLTKPVTVTQELARLLRPGGLLAITFSNRLFITKASKQGHTPCSQALPHCSRCPHRVLGSSVATTDESPVLPRVVCDAAAFVDGCCHSGGGSVDGRAGRGPRVDGGRLPALRGRGAAVRALGQGPEPLALHRGPALCRVRIPAGGQQQHQGLTMAQERGLSEHRIACCFGLEREGS